MRVGAVDSYSQANNRVKRKSTNLGTSGVRPLVGSNVVAFTSRTKNMHQLASFTPENNGLGLNEAAQGGEGCVGYEVVDSLRKHENIDARSFMPFWEHDNPKGGYKFLIHREKDYPDWTKGSTPKEMPESAFYSAELGETKEAVAKKFGLKENEISYVIQSRPKKTQAGMTSKYCLLEPTTVKGEVERLSDSVLGETEKIPYALFKISSHNPDYNKLKGQPHYFVYTPQLARAAKPYAYDCWGNVPFDAEISNSDWMRSLAEIVNSKMNTEEFGNFNPANQYCHDRVAHTYANHLANMSARGNKDVNGLKVHIWVHNSGRNYQGLTGNPFQMLTVVGDASDASTIRALPEFELLSKAKKYGFESLSPREQSICWAVLEPALRPFRDESGTYNILKTGISAVKQNPDNISLGTVSYQFDKEMKSQDTPDAAKFLTKDYASIETKTVLNGVTPANLELGNPTKAFGRGENGLSLPENLKGYTPYTYVSEADKVEFDNHLNSLKGEDRIKFEKTHQNVTTDIRDVVIAREKNAQWLTNLIWNAGEKGEQELKKLFFDNGQIADGHGVLGYLSPVKKGEILVFGFGRPDEQKGFPITTEGFLEFLKDKNIPKSKKQKVKVLLGAGPWNKDAEDYKSIVKNLNEIWQLDGGAYKHNIMYIDGFTPNRIVACATHSMFTSRREMCGITPIESKIAGTPYGATATGGPVDYTNPSNGWLTKEPVELRPERYGLTYEASAQEIDKARVQRQATQVKTIFEEMIDEYTDNKEAYIAKCKKSIEEKVDWHNNAEYNHGKSANKRYLEDVLEVDKGWEARSKRPLKRLLEKFGTYKNDVETMMEESGKKLPRNFRFVYAILGTVAVLTGVYFIVKNRQKPSTKKLDNVA